MKSFFLLACASWVSALSFAAGPETAWPEKPVTVVVPFPAGGATDAAARAMATQMQATLGQSFVVDNRPGATGTLGAGAVKRAAPDGYTLMVSSLGTYVIAPHLFKAVPYDALKDFDYLSVLVQAPNVLVAAPGKKARTVADVLAELKANPLKVSFASSGNGASDHLSAEVFWQQTGTSGLHIPYKGGAPAINDLLGNQVDYSFQNVNAVLQHIRAGKLHAIAVTGSRRSPVLPDTPTLAEAGVRNAEIYSWQGLAAPRGLPPAVREKIAATAAAAMRDPKVAARLTEQGLEIVASTPAEFSAFQAREFARWKTLIDTRKITLD
jgi:tripartite-type tricarboxylate transporter receptor subunit TctC